MRSHRTQKQQRSSSKGPSPPVICCSVDNQTVWLNVPQDMWHGKQVTHTTVLASQSECSPNALIMTEVNKQRVGREKGDDKVSLYIETHIHQYGHYYLGQFVTLPLHSFSLGIRAMFKPMLIDCNNNHLPLKKRFVKDISTFDQFHPKGNFFDIFVCPKTRLTTDCHRILFKYIIFCVIHHFRNIFSR